MIAIDSHFHSLEEIDIQLKNRLERKRSNDTTSGGSNVTVIEGNVPEEVIDSDGFGGSRAVIESDTVCAKASDESAVKPAPLASCIFRRDSVRASIKKKVRCSEATEVIPPPDYFINEDDGRQISHEDDDDVFCDSAPVQTPRGNMCTPYVDRKGSLPGLEALPDWFPNSRLTLSEFNFSLLFVFHDNSSVCSSLFVCSVYVFRSITTRPRSFFFSSSLGLSCNQEPNICCRLPFFILFLSRSNHPWYISYVNKFLLIFLMNDQISSSFAETTVRLARHRQRLLWMSLL